ncbi:MAG: radical SAM peptide maturase [Bacteroidales bacterium]|jgi:uncharacterized protein|nr:radical SAM peptide maturase [Bacteroidales bacterium]
MKIIKQSKIMNYTIYNTDNGNTYLYSFYKQQTILLSPGLEFIVNKLAESQQNIDFIEQNVITFKNKIYNKKELSYYYNKYIFLKENDFFKEIDTKEVLSGKIKQTDIEDSLNNVKNLTFEITEKCNLKCRYCVYGDNYSVHSAREYIDLDYELAQKTIDYFVLKWLSDSNNFYRKIVIGFYGGEALLRFDTVIEIVNYLKTISKTTGLNFQFIMTTNGILLDKYIDFLVENDFWLTISLDGNAENNSYRVFNKNRTSYDKVVSNIKLIQDKFTDFYFKNVNFSTVLHDKNNEYQVNEFFNKNFIKSTRSSVAKVLDKKNENLFQYQPTGIYEIIKSNKDYKKFVSTSSPINFMMFFKNYFGIISNNYSEITNEKYLTKYYPTGSCSPFSKKIFISAQGNIYPCERINFRFVFGKITSEKIEINTKEIAAQYNNYFLKMQKQCANCYNFIYCQSCFFASIIKDDDSIVCPNFISKNSHSDFLSFYWSFCEKFPNFYTKIIKNFIYE